MANNSQFFSMALNDSFPSSPSHPSHHSHPSFPSHPKTTFLLNHFLRMPTLPSKRAVRKAGVREMDWGETDWLLRKLKLASLRPSSSARRGALKTSLRKKIAAQPTFVFYAFGYKRA